MIKVVAVAVSENNNNNDDNSDTYIPLLEEVEVVEAMNVYGNLVHGIQHWKLTLRKRRRCRRSRRQGRIRQPLRMIRRGRRRRGRRGDIFVRIKANDPFKTPQ